MSTTQKKQDKNLDALQSVKPKGQYIAEELIEDWLKKNYQLRINEIKCYPEMYDSKRNYWESIDDLKLNSLRLTLIKNRGIKTSTKNLDSILYSDCFESVNPVVEYFEDLPKYKKGDPILNLFNCLEIKDVPEDAEISLFEIFKKWMVACVAQAVSPHGAQNHTCLVFTGGQGIGKTTFGHKLVPATLKDYYYAGHIQLDNKDSQTFLAECFIINIDDQLQKINRKDENAIKSYITAASVKYRRPYARRIKEYPRMASFFATVNGNEFLNDPTGSRRFLPLEVLKIDLDTLAKIDIDKVWSEAYHHYKSGFRYHFNLDEISTLHAYNESFIQHTQEEQLLTQYFEPATADEFNMAERQDEGFYFLSTAMINSFINKKTSIKLYEKRLSDALKRNGFHKAQLYTGGIRPRGWYVKLLGDDSIMEWVVENHNYPPKVAKHLRSIGSTKP